MELKPEFECIVVARKPFKGSCVDNIIKYGVGGLNIDECRVAYEKTTNPATNPLYRQQNKDKYKQVQGGETSNGAVPWTSGKNGVSELGRFPANLILTYSDENMEEVCSGFPNTKGGTRHNTAIRQSEKNSGYGFDVNTRNEFNDSGSASRYFYCAKASKKDRDEGLDEFEEKKVYGEDMQWGYGNNNGDNFGERVAKVTRKNTHPTVKPCDLMQYLIRLVTPNGGTILDPFNGSGSTGKAAMYENLEKDKDYKYIGIEMTEEYLPISQARIEYVISKEKE